MNAYIYQAALLCEKCANKVKASIPAFKTRTTQSEDSDYWPQGPYADGGGEADCPQHCDHCHVFLENPLTSDGYEYVKEAVQDWQDTSRGNGDVIAEWQSFYL